MKYLLPFFNILLVCSVHNAYAQNTIGLPQIINYNSNDFHAGAQTWDIKQDKSGIMYFANNDGLITFDGSHWRVFQQANKSILRSIAIVDEKIYAGGQDEIGYFFPAPNGQLVYKSLKNLIPDKFSKFSDVWDVEVYKDAVFFRTWDYIFEYKNNIITTHPAPNGWHFLKSTGERLFAKDKAQGLFEFINGKWLPVYTKKDIAPLEITGLIILKNNDMLISTLRGGIYTLHEGILSRRDIAANALLNNSHIYSFEAINDHEYLAGTTTNGCVFIDSSLNFVQQISISEGLQNNNILCIYLDKQKNLWTGLDNGISFIAYNSPLKYIHPGKPNEPSGYYSKIFNNNLYIATSEGAYMVPLSQQNAGDLSFSRGKFTKIKNSDGQVWRFDEINNELLMCHNNGSYQIKNDEAVPLTLDPGIWQFLPISTVSPYKKVVAGTYSRLYMFEFNEKGYAGSHEMNGVYESLRFMAVDNENNIWASHPYRGIYKISLSPDDKSYSSTLFTEKNGLPSTLRNFVFRVKNRVVFPTVKGIYEFDEKEQRFYPSPLLHKIFDTMSVQYMTEDADGNIWFCNEKNMGVVTFSKDNSQYRITYFPELTGKILSGFEHIYTYNPKNVFIASKNGIIHFNYENYITNKPKLTVLLSTVKAFGKSDSLVYGGYAPGNNNLAFKQDKNTTPHFSVSENSFHFEFSSPAYGMQNNIEYSYQLVGYDSKWSAWSSKNEKDYTNLPSGTYTFNVRAHDNMGNKSEVISYIFVVEPAWYMTTWAFLLYFIIGISLLYLFYKWQMKKFHLQQIKFEEEQNRLKYIHQLEIEKNEKEIIKLQNEKLANEVLYKNKELADANLHLVERNDALIKVKDELRQLYKKTGGNHDVKKAMELVNDIEKNNSSWEQFAIHFDEINNDFLKKLSSKYPNLTNTDLKVCAYLKLKLASKEIAQLMNITVRGVELSRYRLRKKLQLDPGKTLTDFLNEIQQSE